MKIRTLLFILFLTGISLTFNCRARDPETGNPIVEKGKVLIIEPYLEECNCFGKEECLVINGEIECEGIRGFEHEEGMWEKISVNVFERLSEVQDVGKYGYVFTAQLDEIHDEDNPNLRRMCEFYGGQWGESLERSCVIEDDQLLRRYCDHIDSQYPELCQ